jgi:predicted PurR-regulated permease PerM
MDARPVSRPNRNGLLPGAPRWVSRGFVLCVAVVVSLPLLRDAVMSLRGIATTVLLAMFASFALEPPVAALTRRGWRRGLAAGAVMAGLALAVMALGFVLGQAVVTQGRQLIDALPQVSENAQVWLARRGVDVQLDSWVDRAQDQAGERAVGVLGSAAGVLFQSATALFFAFYLVVDGPRLRRALGSLLPPERQTQMVRVWEIAVDRTGRYIASRVALAAISAAAHTVVFTAIGVPWAVALGVWVGVLSQLIPVVGTYLAGTLPVVVALGEDPMLAVWVLAAVVVYQQVENYLLSPRIQSRFMDIHPAFALGSVVVGAAVFGPVGALLALPATATVQAFVSTYLHRYELIDELAVPSTMRDVTVVSADDVGVTTADGTPTHVTGPGDDDDGSGRRHSDNTGAVTQ